MARIIVAEDAGACFGVERALSLALDEACIAPRGIFTMGPIVHNARVVEELGAQGIEQRDIEDLPFGSKLIVRAHGVTPHELTLANERGLVLVDATCPFVKRVQQLAHSLEAQGYQLILLGDKGHAEVVGICGHAPSTIVVSSLAELAELDIQEPVAVIAQTTQSRETLQSLMDALSERGIHAELHDTICDATTKHQAGAQELAAQVDVMLVLGGYHSANTCRLAELCCDICPKTHHIELPEELDSAWFLGAETIGVTAGASTPQAQITELLSALEAMLGE